MTWSIHLGAGGLLGIIGGYRAGRNGFFFFTLRRLFIVECLE